MIPGITKSSTIILYHDSLFGGFKPYETNISQATIPENIGGKSITIAGLLLFLDQPTNY